MWVIKLGGSLLGTLELTKWLETIVKHSDGKVVIVPGGGLFADAVREAQKISCFSDAVAHKMALLAMDQFGVMLADLNPALVTASSELEIAERGWQHRGIVWLPSKMVLVDERIPKSWQVTSDSLAAWLASKLEAEQLVLVKSKPFQTDTKCVQATIHTLSNNGFTDHAFSTFCADHYASWIVHKSDYHLFAQGFNGRVLVDHAVAIVR